MRRAHAAVIGICVVVTGCGATVSNAESPSPTRNMIPRPLTEREISGLLLSPEQVAQAMGSPPMTVTESQSAMADNSAIMAPPECLALDGAAEAAVYSSSGFTAERDQSLNDGDAFKHYTKQAVVLFPYLEKAAEFFDASVQQWPACHQYTHTQSGTQWTVGEIRTADRVLSTESTLQEAAAPGWGCGRALAQANNVIVDVNTCSADPADTAVKIAQQIAANVTAKW
ncbi:MAG: sensor domain-containing protein [Actinomycetota bacterium]